MQGPALYTDSTSSCPSLSLRAQRCARVTHPGPAPDDEALPATAAAAASQVQRQATAWLVLLSWVPNERGGGESSIRQRWDGSACPRAHRACMQQINSNARCSASTWQSQHRRWILWDGLAHLFAWAFWTAARMHTRMCAFRTCSSSVVVGTGGRCGRGEGEDEGQPGAMRPTRHSWYGSLVWGACIHA